MNPWIEYLVLPLVGVVVGFLTKALTTKRERKKMDLEIINAAITPLLRSITELTEQNRLLINKLTEEQMNTLEYMKKNKDLLEERSELMMKIDKLTKQMEALKKMLRDHLKDIPLNED